MQAQPRAGVLGVRRARRASPGKGLRSMGCPEALQEDKAEIRKAEDMTTPWLLTFLLLLAPPLDYFVKGKDGRWG